jgi:hypothetical protein
VGLPVHWILVDEQQATILFGTEVSEPGFGRRLRGGAKDGVVVVVVVGLCGRGKYTGTGGEGYLLIKGRGGR